MTVFPGRWRRASLLMAAGTAISVLSLAWVLRNVDAASVWSIASGADGRFLLPTIGVLAVQVGIRSARWRLLLPRPGDGRPAVPVRRIVPVAMVGYLANAVLPARLGEAVRSVVLARREGLPVPETLGSSVLERVIDTAVLAAIGVAAAVGIGGTADRLLPVAFIGLALSAAALSILLIAPGIVRGISRRSLPAFRRLLDLGHRVAEGAHARGWRRIAGTALLSLAAWALDAATYWLVAQSLGLSIGITGAVLVSAIAVLSTAVPSAPGYLGTFELAVVAAVGALGIAGETALAFAWVAHAVVVIPLSIGGAVSLLALGARARSASPVVERRVVL